MHGTPTAGTFAIPVSRRVGIAALLAYVLLLVSLPWVDARWPAASLFNAFYRSGALVFGGGHVVLPLLRNAFVGPGWMPDDLFLSGYGAAQALPGPLFAFAAYVGALAAPKPNGAAGALLGVIAIFLPGFLVLLGSLPFWASLRRQPRAQASMSGVNAAVVGLLAAALYNPLWRGSVHSFGDMAIALGAFILLMACRAPAWLVVVLAALAGLAV